MSLIYLSKVSSQHITSVKKRAINLSFSNHLLTQRISNNKPYAIINMIIAKANTEISINNAFLK